MDEIREIDNEGDRSIFSMRIYSDRLKTLVRECPDDGQAIHATGDMYFDKSVDRWYVQYYCPQDGEMKTWQPGVDALTRQIAADVLGQAGADSLPKS